MAQLTSFHGKWWRIAKSIAKISKKQEPTPPMKAHGRIYFHPRDKANVFNEFFSKIYTLDNEPDLPPQGSGPHYLN